MSELRVIRCRPTPSDDELEAERDRKHAAEVEEWMGSNRWAMDNGSDVAVAMAYNDGWFGAFKAAQDELAALIAAVEPHGTQRFALIMAAERLSLLANGRAVPLVNGRDK